MAKSASATDMLPSGGESEPLLHGGDLDAARRLFPGAPEPFIDLSTGINPHPYPVPRLPVELFARLPARAWTDSLAAIAAKTYRAPSAAHVVPAPGTQILLPLVARLVPPGRAAVLTPTYGEFARACALAGHRVTEVREISALADADLAIVANPNNPDGRVLEKDALIALAGALRRRGGVLVVDEAFMDTEPSGSGLASDVTCGNIVVLRSFGKFFGLGGVRLGFAAGAAVLAQRLSAALGPWAVSGPALAIGAKALADTAWIERTQRRLAGAAGKLDAILIRSKLHIVGGTPLFRLVRTPAATVLFHHLGRAGIFVRMFADHADWIRFGLPAKPGDWQRLEATMAAFHESR